MSLRPSGIALLAFVSACSGSAGELACPDKSQGTPGNCKIICTNTSECLLDEVCEQGLCTPLTDGAQVALTYLRAIPAVLPAGGGQVELEVVSVNADALNVMSDSASVPAFVSQQVVGRIPIGRVTESVTLSVQARRGEELSQALDVFIQVDETAGLPVINQFSVNPFSLPAGGGAVTGTAEMENFRTAEIWQGDTLLHRDITSSPFVFTSNVNVTTVFELRVSGDGGMVEDSFQVSVGEVQPGELAYELQLSTPQITRPGDVVHLSWNKIAGGEVLSLELELSRANGGSELIVSLPPRLYESGRLSVAVPPPAGQFVFTLAAQDGLTTARASGELIVSPQLSLNIVSASVEDASRFLTIGDTTLFAWEVSSGPQVQPVVFGVFGGAGAEPLAPSGMRPVVGGNSPTDILLVTNVERRQYGYAYDRVTPINQTPNEIDNRPVDLSLGAASGVLPQNVHRYKLATGAGDRLSVRLDGNCRAAQIAVVGPTSRVVPTTTDARGCPQVVAARCFGSGDTSIDVTASAEPMASPYSILAWRRGADSHQVFSDRYEATVENQLPVQPAGLVPITTAGADLKVDIELPRAFPFYGQLHRSMTVHGSGYVSFGTTSFSRTDFTNSPDPAIAVFAGQFAPGAESSILVGAVDDGGRSYAVVEFQNLTGPDSNQQLSGVLMMRDDGHIFVRYDRVDDTTFFAGLRGSINQTSASHPQCVQLECNGSNLGLPLVVHYAPFDRPPLNP